MAKQTARDTPFFDPMSIAWEEEGLFARDVNGQLVRFEQAQENDFAKDVTLTIDGEDVTVKKATLLTDSQGNIVTDDEGRTIPRFTTIYDAASRRYVKQVGDINPIPILCHQEHMRPVGVCRVCSVEIYRRDKTGKETRGQKLVPACHHPVEEGMIVHTLRSSDTAAAGRVRDSVRVLTELLSSDHLHLENDSSTDANGSALGATGSASVPQPVAVVRSKSPNELAALAKRLTDADIPFDPTRFASKVPHDRGHDFQTSDLISIDHNSCILCERCLRACDEVKQNMVISRSGKGYTAHISFDLNNPMGNSSCVSCGECMISCPTDALTFKTKRVVLSDWQKEMVAQHNCRPVDAETLRALHPMFRVVPYKFLEWNASAAIIRPVKAGEIICRQGDHGSTAYILLGDCKFAIIDEARRGSPSPRGESRGEGAAESTGFFNTILGRFMGRGNSSAATSSANVTANTHSRTGKASGTQTDPFFRRAAEADRDAFSQAVSERADGEKIRRQLSSLGELLAVRGKEELLLGEMSCLSYQRRTATIAALHDGEILEIRRNILYMLQRNPAARDMLDKAYRSRALDLVLRSLKAFSAPNSNLAPGESPGAAATSVIDQNREQELYDFLKGKVSLIRVEPGQLVFRQGENVTDFFVVRVGYVKVTQTYFGREKVLDYLGPGRHFGEVGLLSKIEGLQAELGDEQLPQEILGKRTATCAALDHVELVRIPGEAFNQILRTYPHLRTHYLQIIRNLLSKNRQARGELNTDLTEYLDQGLFNAQKLLVLDLERCTRCDECAKACADTHGGVTRLKRDGLRFGKFLVASACRSCEDPYCLVGCPVDAIHRGEGSEIKIESHCIGCGLCEANCPYGNIRMWSEGGADHHNQLIDDPNALPIAPRRVATTCDLCVSVIGPNTGKAVSCVYACPHEAAFRMSGGELFQLTAKS